MSWEESARRFLANLERAGVAAHTPLMPTLIPAQNTARAEPKSAAPAIG